MSKESYLGTLEHQLCYALIVAHLEAGGAVSLKSETWQKQEGLYVAETGSWETAVHAADALFGHLQIRREKIDNIAFHGPAPDEKTSAGVTWRFLKLDFPFLRLVLGRDASVMPAMIIRLTTILENTMKGNKE